MKTLKIILLITFLFTLLACSQNVVDVDEKIYVIETTTTSQVEDEEVVPKKTVAFLDLLNDEELKYLDQMRAENGLVVAIRKSGPVYRVDEDGMADGFHYNLVRYFSELIDMPLSLNVVNFSTYFERNGQIPQDVKNNETLYYTPDVLKDSYLISDNLTIIDWRLRLMDFIQLIPVSIVVITTDDVVVENEADLQDLRVAIETNTSYYTEVQRLNEALGLNLTIVPVESGKLAVDYILEGKADFTLKDSNAALYEAKSNERLNVSLSISQAEYIGWAVAKDNQTLKSILEKFVEYALESGELDLYWEKEYGVPIRIYSELLGVLEYDIEK